MGTFIHLIQLICSLWVTAGYITSRKGSIEIKKGQANLDVASKECREQMSISAYEDMISFESKVCQVTVFAISLQSLILHVGI